MRRNTPKTSTTRGNIKRTTARRRWQVVAIEALPSFLKDNEYLLHGHRPELPSADECMQSVFRVHTETCNIWTHLIGCASTILLSVYYLMTSVTDWAHGLTFSVFFLGATFCLAASTAFHIFLCHSESVSRYMAKIDYCGVIVLIVTSFVPWLYFGFYCHSRGVKFGYLSVIISLGTLCLWFVCHDGFRQPRFRPLRAGLFICLGLTGVVPGAHYIITEGHIIGYHDWLILMGALYVAGGLIYAVRVPERLWPGKFDLWCHSHQILHVCVLGGVATCYYGVSRLAQHRISLGDAACPTIL